MTDIDLSGELVVISGGAGALGRCICTRLANCGATVVSIDVADDGEDQDGGRLEHVWRLRADISESSAVDTALEAVRERFGRYPTTVCCHAGVVASYPILDYPLDAFDQLFRANVRGAFVLAQAASRRWREAELPGHIIFTSSWVQDYPWPEIGPYCASKAAMFSLMRSFAKELAPYGIRANAVLPGIVSAGMARRQWDERSCVPAKGARCHCPGEPSGPEQRGRRVCLPVQPDGVVHDRFTAPGRWWLRVAWPVCNHCVTT